MFGGWGWKFGRDRRGFRGVIPKPAVTIRFRRQLWPPTLAPTLYDGSQEYGELVVPFPWGERRTAVAAKSAMLNVYPEEGMAFTSCAMITFIPNNLIVSDTPSISLTIIEKEGDEATFTPLPVVAKFEGTNDIVVVYIKQSASKRTSSASPSTPSSPGSHRRACERISTRTGAVRAAQGAERQAALDLAAREDGDARPSGLAGQAPVALPVVQARALVRSTADMKKHSALDYGKAAQRACDAGCARERAAAK